MSCFDEPRTLQNVIMCVCFSGHLSDSGTQSLWGGAQQGLCLSVTDYWGSWWSQHYLDTRAAYEMMSTNLYCSHLLMVLHMSMTTKIKFEYTFFFFLCKLRRSSRPSPSRRARTPWTASSYRRLSSHRFSWSPTTFAIRSSAAVLNFWRYLHYFVEMKIPKL